MDLLIWLALAIELVSLCTFYLFIRYEEQQTLRETRCLPNVEYSSAMFDTSTES